MAMLIDTFIPAQEYNALGHITNVANAPEAHANDLEELRETLAKHHVPEKVCIRLIHKHFDALDGEVMVFDKVSLPLHGTVQIMKPVVPSPDSKLRGIHFYVNDAGFLQAFEYTTSPVPDMTGFEPFLREFCKIVVEKGLQHKFGLKLKGGDDLDNVGWTEFEFHEKRSTVMLQDGMPMPDGDFDFTVSTEWNVPRINQLPRDCKHSVKCSHGHSNCKHCTHCNAHPTAPRQNQNQGLFLGGHEVLPGSDLHDMVKTLVAAF